MPVLCSDLTFHIGQSADESDQNTRCMMNSAAGDRGQDRIFVDSIAQRLTLYFLGLILAANGLSHSANGQFPLASCDRPACGESGCDSSSSSSFGCSKKGSSGTLFRWSNGCRQSFGPALSEPLVTDRPDFTEASSTVGQGIAQLEIGYTYSFDNDGPGTTKAHSYPEPLLRYGVFANWMELRIGWNYLDEEVGGVESTGSDDLYLGVKLGLTPQEGFLPEMALIPQMKVPTGDDDFTAKEVLPGLNWIYGWEITDSLATAGSTQFNRAVDNGSTEAYTEWAQSWTVAWSWTDRLGSYAEYFGLYPHSADTVRSENYFNGGFTYLLSNDIQWDVRAGTGLNTAAMDYFVGTGLSIRFQ